MREILFRGKRTDNDEWVKGFYCVFNKKKHLIYTGYAEAGCGNYYPDAFEIDPSTVGQYTGLTDKYGEKIFEDDIVLLKGEEELYQVDFADGCFFFIRNGVRFTIDFFNEYYDHDIEAIGNVYDNPELLKEREQK